MWPPGGLLGASRRPLGGLPELPGACGEALGGVQEGPNRVCTSIEASEGVKEASSRPPGGASDWKVYRGGGFGGVLNPSERPSG